MVNLIQLGLGALAAAPALGMPFQGPPGRRTGSLAQVRTAGARLPRSGSRETLKTYNKFGADVPAGIRSGLEALVAAAAAARHHQRRGGESGEVPLQALPSDSSYVFMAGLGTPAQNVTLLLDTGSSDLWVASATDALLSGGGGSGSAAATYNPLLSSTVNATSDTWAIQYGDGSSASGDVDLDVVNLGGVTAPQQAIEVATQESSSFLSSGEFAGLAGFGFDKLNTIQPVKQKTFFDNVKDDLAAPLFAVDMKHQGSTFSPLPLLWWKRIQAGTGLTRARTPAGSLDLGVIDKSKYTGELAYTAVNASRGFWTFTSPGFAVGDGAFNPTAVAGIADTGTTLLYLPEAVVAAYYAGVQGARVRSSDGSWGFDCAATPPPFSFLVADGAAVTIPGAYLNFGTDDSSSGSGGGGDGSCYGGIQNDTGMPFSIFGAMALKAAFVVFENDGVAPRLGFANKTL